MTANKKSFTYLSLTSALALAFLGSLSVNGADRIWNNGAATANWNTTDSNWTGSTWSDLDNAIFENRNETLTLTQPITAGTFTMRNGGRESGNHDLVLSGGSLAFACKRVDQR